MVIAPNLIVVKQGFKNSYYIVFNNKINGIL